MSNKRRDYWILAVVLLLGCASAASGDVSSLSVAASAHTDVKVDGVTKDVGVKMDYNASGTESSITVYSGLARAFHIEDGETLDSQAYSTAGASVRQTADTCSVEAQHRSWVYSEVETIAGKTTEGNASTAYTAVADMPIVEAPELDEGERGVVCGEMDITVSVTVTASGVGVWHMSPVYKCEFKGGQYLTAQWNGLVWVVHSYVVRSVADAMDGNKRTFDIDFVSTEDLVEGVEFFYEFTTSEYLSLAGTVNETGWNSRPLRTETHGPATAPQTESIQTVVSGSSKTAITDMLAY